MERGLYNRDLDIVFPKEGSFSFDIRIFSHSPIEERLIQEIKGELEDGMKLGHDGLDIASSKVMDDGDYKNETVNIRYLTSSYIKNINGVGKFAFVSDYEHHLLSLLYILVTLFLVKAVFKALGVE